MTKHLAVNAKIPVQSNIEASSHSKILYLDDDIAVLQSVSHLLKMLGFTVVGFQNQKEALDAIREDPFRFDVVVTDYHMPSMSGLEIAGEIHKIRNDIPVAITSGFIDEELRTKASAMGVRELIAKPIVWKHFNEVIRGMVK